ncbi:MAG: sulfatase-like hydrolase/transferase [Gemmatimonadales bacterium]|nr:sulfatase-like hydrolase/transferase [Gemmatimonadales bacterium]NIQ98654.1 sulfatase-like hydrolase/transferase [Gemmatimonadales bacterium]
MSITARLPSAPVAIVLLAACQGNETDAPTSDVAGGPRPNVVVIVVDDLRWDEFGAAGHPYLETPNIDRLAREGGMFVNSFHAVPLCSPNRASLLTGQYPSRHGIIDNVARNRASHRLETFPRALQKDGYETAFVGKWHMGNDPTPRPGFDYWVGLPGQGRTVDPILYEDGSLREVRGYVTDILTDRAAAFIERDRQKPFLLYLAHKAVHPDARQLDDGSVDLNYPSRYIPAPRHRGMYESEVFQRRPNVVVSVDDLADKPALRRALAYRASDDITETFGGILDPGTSEETIRRRAEMLLAVDEGLGRILTTLDERGMLDHTLVLFTSDNGFFYGEHGLSLERRLPYEESIRNPLLIRYPPLVSSGTRVSELVLTVDIAPTVLEAAGAPIGDHIQGRSLMPLFGGESTAWRQSLLVEFYTYENPMPWLMDMDYRAVRTERYKYIHWMKYPELDELYDLESDPYEMRNLVDSARFREVRRDLRAELGRLVLAAMGLTDSN